jgi:hypothetical protein
MDSSLKNIVVLLIIITIGFAGYYMFVQTNVTESTDTTDNTYLKEDMYNNTQLFIEYRTKLNSVVINDLVFENPLFNSYHNFTQPINTQNVSRSNPFADVGATGGAD